MGKDNLKFGKNTLYTDITDKHIIHTLVPKDTACIVDVEKEVKTILEKPLITNTLKSMINKDEKIAIIVSDTTRSWIKSDKFRINFVGGEFEKDWLKGYNYIRSIYSESIQSEEDIIIAPAEGYPKDINLYQTIKTMDDALYGGKENEVLILLSECLDGLSADEFLDWFKYRTLEGMENALKDNFTVSGYAAYKTVYTAKYRKVVLISSLDDELVENFNMIPCHDLGGAVRMAYNLCDYEEPKIRLMPYVEKTLPISL